LSQLSHPQQQQPQHHTHMAEHDTDTFSHFHHPYYQRPPDFIRELHELSSPPASSSSNNRTNGNGHYPASLLHTANDSRTSHTEHHRRKQSNSYEDEDEEEDREDGDDDEDDQEDPIIALANRMIPSPQHQNGGNTLHQHIQQSNGRNDNQHHS
jgi:hypothetical protein